MMVCINTMLEFNLNLPCTLPLLISVWKCLLRTDKLPVLSPRI